MMNILVHFIATMYQGHQFDAMVVEVGMKLVTIVDNDLVIHHSHNLPRGLYMLARMVLAGSNTPLVILMVVVREVVMTASMVWESGVARVSPLLCL